MLLVLASKVSVPEAANPPEVVAVNTFARNAEGSIRQIRRRFARAEAPRIEDASGAGGTGGVIIVR